MKAFVQKACPKRQEKGSTAFETQRPGQSSGAHQITPFPSIKICGVTIPAQDKCDLVGDLDFVMGEFCVKLGFCNYVSAAELLTKNTKTTPRALAEAIVEAEGAEPEELPGWTEDFTRFFARRYGQAISLNPTGQPEVSGQSSRLQAALNALVPPDIEHHNHMGEAGGRAGEGQSPELGAPRSPHKGHT